MAKFVVGTAQQQAAVIAQLASINPVIAFAAIPASAKAGIKFETWQHNGTLLVRHKLNGKFRSADALPPMFNLIGISLADAGALLWSEGWAVVCFPS